MNTKNNMFILKSPWRRDGVVFGLAAQTLPMLNNAKLGETLLALAGDWLYVEAMDRAFAGSV